MGVLGMEKAVRCFLGECENRIPVLVTGENFQHLVGVLQLDTGNFGVPAAAEHLAGSLERSGWIGQGSHCPGKLAGVAWEKLKVKFQGRERSLGWDGFR